MSNKSINQEHLENPENQGSDILKNQGKTKEEQDKITYRIIGCAMEVHNTLGNGFQEVIYQRCLSIELRENVMLQLEKEFQNNYFSKLKIKGDSENVRKKTSYGRTKSNYSKGIA